MTIRIVPILTALMLVLSGFLTAAPAQAAVYSVTSHTCKGANNLSTGVTANIYWYKGSSGSMDRNVTGVSVRNPTASTARVYVYGDNRQDVTYALPKTTRSYTFSSPVRSADPWVYVTCTLGNTSGPKQRKSLGWL